MTEGGEATARFPNCGSVGEECGVETDIIAGGAPVSADQVDCGVSGHDESVEEEEAETAPRMETDTKREP